MINRNFRPLLATLLLVTALACGDSAKTPKVLRVGFVPSEDAAQVMQNAQPVVEILRKELGMEIQPFVATDYTGVVEALRANKLDVAFLTPASYVLAKNETNVKVVLKSERKGIPSYYAAIITRTDSGIKTLEDLRGKTFAFGDSLSTTGQDVQAAWHRSGARFQASALLRRPRRHGAGGAQR
jgi:phosphonate transport system substrate-binding protein